MNNTIDLRPIVSKSFRQTNEEKEILIIDIFRRELFEFTRIRREQLESMNLEELYKLYNK